VLRIDLAGCTGKERVLERFAQALRFPDWFGGNFDALADSLGDLSWLRADGYVLLIEHSDAWRRADDDNFAMLLDILNEAAASWGDQGVPFWALMLLPQQELEKLAI
jgi:RNAse (barnase) inhibitor barstar